MSIGFGFNHATLIQASWKRACPHSRFQIFRIRGSHHTLRHPDGRYTVVPVHAGEIMGPGLLLKILKDAELSRDDLEK
ncbi:MAG: type II toxin-antitoxin system HicA family toxin [Verrucomicrobiota bacterium]